MSQEGPKDPIRKAALLRRGKIPPEVRRAKAAMIKERLFSLPEFEAAKAVLFYASFRDEVETGEMVKEALSLGHRVMLPKVNKGADRLDLYEISSQGDLEAGYMGIPEPPALEEKLRGVGDVEVVVMPGAAFDERGGRIGYGKGYYDKLLSEDKSYEEGPGRGRPCLLALAFEEQVAESIPAESHDIRVDAVLTEKRVIWTGKR